MKSYQQSQSQQSIENRKYFCQQQQQAFQFCTNQKCLSNQPFICFTPSCNCRKFHKNCLKGDISYVLQKIKQKQNEGDSLKKQVQHTFDKIIDLLSDVRDKLIFDISNNKTQFINLTDIERPFLELGRTQNIKQGQENQKIQQVDSWNGEKRRILWSQISQAKQNNQDNHFTQQIIKELNQLQLQQQQMIIAFQQNLKQIFQKKIKINQLTILNSQNPSKIVKNSIDQSKLLNLFQQKVKSIKLTFRASQHKFKVEKFYQNNNKNANTLIIGLTEKQKIIGAYSPLSLPTREGWQKDASKKSFIFSLTQNDKLNLKNPDYAIYSWKNNQKIWFGSYCQFGIWNMNDNSSLGQSFFTHQATYENKKYGDNKQSYLRFNGNQSKDYRLVQWQVFQVQFQK